MGDLILPLSIFWMAALVLCLLNNRLRGGEKVAWMLFIIFTNWFGSLAYFIYWYGFAKKRAPQSQARQTSQASTTQPYYSPYTQGYQPVVPTSPQTAPMQTNDPGVSEQEDT